jgi:hypothetical protein
LFLKTAIQNLILLPCVPVVCEFKGTFPYEISELEHLLWYSDKDFVKKSNDFQVCGSLGYKCVVRMPEKSNHNILYFYDTGIVLYSICIVNTSKFPYPVGMWELN